MSLRLPLEFYHSTGKKATKIFEICYTGSTTKETGEQL